MKSFRFFYLLFLGVFYLLFFPFIFILSLKTKYRHSLFARFFYLQATPSKDTEIWFHACSFGEVKSLEPILTKLLEQEKHILLTTTTQTGFDLALKIFANKKNFQVLYLPFELLLPLWKSHLTSLKTLVVTESELWFMLFFTAKTLRAKTFLVNARISDRSYDRYLKFRFYYARVFALIDKVFAQSKNDALRLEHLGAKNIEVFGNLKIFTKIEPTRLYNKPNKLVIVAGSTHLDEERLVLKSFLEFKKSYPHSLLILAPRHPERFDDVYEMLEGLKVSRVSQDGIDEESDVLLLDILGDLNNIYRIADIVILCGSFVKVGGHNPLEPAFFETKLLSGPYIFNQYALFDCIEGYIIVQDDLELTQRLLEYKTLPHSKIKNQNQKLDILLENFVDE